MELRHLRYFVAVAEELHFGRAALGLHMAQPPLSQQIRALEEELGVRLLERTSRSVRLTPAGAAYLAEARAVLDRVEEAGRQARRIHQGEAGELRVGFMNPVMDAVLCRALAAFRGARPDVTLALRELSSPEQLAELHAGRLDVAFIRLTGEQDRQGLTGLATRVVVREPYVLALPKGHRLSRLALVPLRLAGAEPLILFPRAAMPGLHADMLAALRQSGAVPRIVQEISGKHASLALVAAGLGVCLVPASARDWLRRGVVLRPVESGLPVVEMAAAWPLGTDNPGVAALVELAAN